MSSKLTIGYADAATAEHVRRCLDNDPDSAGLAVSRVGNRVQIEADNLLLDGVMNLVGRLASSIVLMVEKLVELTGRPALAEKNTVS